MYRPRCKKRRLIKGEARSAVRRSVRYGDATRRERRYYFCVPCKAYHLTSQEKDKRHG